MKGRRKTIKRHHTYLVFLNITSISFSFLSNIASHQILKCSAEIVLESTLSWSPTSLVTDSAWLRFRGKKPPSMARK